MFRSMRFGALARFVVTVGFVGCALAVPPAAAAAAPPVSTEVVSAGANGASDELAVSSDGRFVAFTSSASNLVAGDTNNWRDVFVRDRQTGVVSRVSVGASATQGNGASAEPSISADGRFVAFSSLATNLVSGDTNGVSDVFVHDRQTGSTSRVSVDAAGAQLIGGNSYRLPVIPETFPSPSTRPRISPDGRRVAFRSETYRWFTCGNVDFFGVASYRIKDRQTGTLTTLVAGPCGPTSITDQFDASFSGDGTVVGVVQRWNICDLQPAGCRNGREIALWNASTGAFIAKHSAEVSNSIEFAGPTVSLNSNGTVVAFASWQGLVAEDTNGRSDVYVWNRALGSVVLASRATGGGGGNHVSTSPALSADGSLVAFPSYASNLVASDSNGTADVFVRNLTAGTTRRVSVSAAGAQVAGAVAPAVMSADGCTVGFVSYAAGLVPTDSNGVADVFVAPTGAPSCTNRAPIAVNDSYTTNEDVVLTVAAPGVLANDTDPDTGDTRTAELVTAPAAGTLVMNADGSLRYTPAVNASGTVTFTYRAKDRNGAVSAVATGSITINPVNDLPIAAADTAAVGFNAPLSIPILANDTDVEGPLTAARLTISTPPTRGTATVDTVVGSVVYSPALNRSGTDTFAYQVCDSDGACVTAPVSLTVAAPTSSVVNIADTTVVEADDGVRSVLVNVSLSRPAASTVSVAWATAPGTATAGADFTTALGTLSFAAGETSKPVVVRLPADTIVEGDESFVINLSNPVGAVVGDGSGLVRILDDDPMTGIRLAANDATIYEPDTGSATVMVTIQLSTASTSPVTLSWRTLDGTATAVSDYARGSNTRRFAPGENTQSIPITITGDTLAEANETLTVELYGVTGATVQRATATITIIDND